MRIYVDVGGTLLLGSNENTSALNLPLIKAITKYWEDNDDVQIVVWSFYGKATAEVVARRAFKGSGWIVMDKVFENAVPGDIIIDDDAYGNESIRDFFDQKNIGVLVYEPDDFTMEVLA